MPSRSARARKSKPKYPHVKRDLALLSAGTALGSVGTLGVLHAYKHSRQRNSDTQSIPWSSQQVLKGNSNLPKGRGVRKNLLGPQAFTIYNDRKYRQMDKEDLDEYRLVFGWECDMIEGVPIEELMLFAKGGRLEALEQFSKLCKKKKSVWPT